MKDNFLESPGTPLVHFEELFYMLKIRNYYNLGHESLYQIWRDESLCQVLFNLSLLRQGKKPVCKAAKGISGAECEITCCDKDLCNAGSETKISGIVLLAFSQVFLAFQEA